MRKIIVISFILVFFILNTISLIEAIPDKAKLLESQLRKEAEETKTPASVFQATDELWGYWNLLQQGLSRIRETEGCRSTGRNSILLSWYGEGKYDREQGNKPYSTTDIFDHIRIDLAYERGPKRPNTIEAANQIAQSSDCLEGIEQGKRSVSEDEKRKAYYIGFFDHNEDGILDNKEALNLIDSWYSNNVDEETLAASLNSWADPITVEFPSDSSIPSIELFAEPSYLSCGINENIKLVAKVRTHKCFPLSDAKIEINTLPSGLVIYPSYVTGTTDEKGEFTSTWSYNIPTSTSCGGDITFSATFQNDWFRLNYQPPPACDNCISAIPSNPKTSITLYTKSQIDKKENENSVMPFEIQVPNSQMAKDELREQLRSTVNSGFRFKYLIQKQEETTTSTTQTPPTGTTVPQEKSTYDSQDIEWEYHIFQPGQSIS
jgi:hypothetical protein